MHKGRYARVMGIGVACSTAVAIGIVVGSEPVRAQSRPVPQPPQQVAGSPMPYPSLKSDVSPRLDALTPIDPPAMEAPMVRINKALPNRAGAIKPGPFARIDSAAQVNPGLAPMPAPVASFDGVTNASSVSPPDTQGAVGPNHYVQWVNLSFAIFDKSGTKVYPPGPGFAAGNTLWAGFGGPCETSNNGDPITLYDRQAGRWLMAQFALPTYPVAPFYECVAVSTTNDPTGAWNRYIWQSPSNKVNDYPHFGVWADGYYMSFNQFSSGTVAWAGQGVVAFERDKMLAGLPAQAVYFDLFGVNPLFSGMLPSDLDGTTPPPAGSPDYFMEVEDNAWGWPTDQLHLFKFHVDWAKVANSTFTGPAVIDLTAAGLGFDANLCGFLRNCIPQAGTTVKIDAIADRLMYRLAYRNFGDHESLVLNHSVDVDGTDHAGIRWYEVRNPGGVPTVFQAGTYAPDADHRWMGSIAMDGSGDIALGFSVSGTALFPSIRYAGRLVSDPLGTLPQSEVTMVAGTGAQTQSTGRWGDYSSMTVDPVDDCTFWYTQEYYTTTVVQPAGGAPWRTRIGSFKFPSCGPGTGSLTGTVTDSATALPIQGAAVQLGTLASTQTAANGTYQFLSVASGTYDVSVSQPGYVPQTLTGVLVTAGGTTTRNAALVAAPCTLTIAPASASPTAAGGAASVALTASAADCAWSAVSNVTWITVSPATASGVGNGTINYTVAANPTNFVRTGTVTIAGQVLTVQQAPANSAPGAPRALTSSSTGSSISLSWNAPASGGPPTSYVIEAGSATGLADLANVSTGNTSTSFAASGVGDGTYFVRVRASNAVGVSGPSNEVTLIVGTVPPGAPSGLVWSSAGSSITLSWTAPGTGDSPAAYTIEAGSSPGLADLANFSTGNTVTSFASSGVGNGTYFLRVRATNTKGASGPSNEVALLVGCTAAPGAPSGLLTTSNSGGTVQFGWTAPNFAGTSNGPTTYVLEAGSVPGLSNLAVLDLGGAGTTVAFGGIGSGTYYVRVKARNLCGTSAASNQFQLIVP